MDALDARIRALKELIAAIEWMPTGQRTNAFDECIL